MTDSTQLAIEDYDAIAEAVMETERGRWFLAEFARRNRQADTLTIVDTLERIERTMKRQRKVPDIDRIRLDLADMAEAITRTKQEIFQMKVESEEGGRFAEASNELDAIVSQTEAATETILLNAEKAQEFAWSLREAGADGELCDNLENAITEIYTGCSFQDLTGQRTRKVVTVLRYLESRINSMTGIWGLDETGEEDGENAIKASPADAADGLEALAKAAELKPDITLNDMQFDPFDTRPDAHLLNGPQLDGRGVDQSEIDDLMNFNSADDFIAVHAEDTGTSKQDRADAMALLDGHDAEQEDIAEQVEAENDPVVLEDTDADSVQFEAQTDVFAFTETDADVFAPTVSEPIAQARPIRTAISGNTALSLDIDADLDEEAIPALKVVKTNDPIADLSSDERLIVFG
jgi:chemotaxis regulatin CheY-phosphate phosphatase CheZ